MGASSLGKMAEQNRNLSRNIIRPSPSFVHLRCHFLTRCICLCCIFKGLACFDHSVVVVYCAVAAQATVTEDCFRSEEMVQGQISPPRKQWGGQIHIRHTDAYLRGICAECVFVAAQHWKHKSGWTKRSWKSTQTCDIVPSFFFLTVSLSYVTQLSEEEIVFSWYCK